MSFVARPPRDVVVASGADALSFLESLLSQDVAGLDDGASAHALLLTPQGKLDVDLRIVRAGDEAWLVCEGGIGPRLVESLGRFKIRVDVEVAVDPDKAVLAVAGVDGSVLSHEEAIVTVPVAWPGETRYDVVGPEIAIDEVERDLVEAGVALISPSDYEEARIRAGVARQGAELDERTIPQEAFLDRDAVSFDKGCFLGQELVCRIDTRGHVNRYLRSLALSRDDVPAGAELVAGGKAVGVITSVAGDAGLGYVRREVEPPADVVVRWDAGEAQARVEELPRPFPEVPEAAR